VTNLPDTDVDKTAPAPAAPSLAQRGRVLSGRWRSAGIVLPFAMLFLVLSVTSGPFLTRDNLLNILDQQSAILIMAAAGTLVLVGGAIDLSVGATYGLAGVVAAQLVPHTGIPFALFAALLVGLLVGLVNGVVTTYFRINALIATLAMSFIIGGLANLVTGGNLLVLTEWPDFANISRSAFLGVRSSIWIAVVCIVAFGLLLSRTTSGRYLYAVGGNAEAARLAGVRLNRVRIAAFMTSGAAAAIAGVIDVSRVLSAQSTSGDALTFTVLAGMVVGGTSIMGGEGAVWRSTVGVLFIALVGNGFDLLGVNPLYQQIALGVILLLAVGADALSRVRR
jgi:ribose transport system permease protein